MQKETARFHLFLECLFTVYLLPVFSAKRKDYNEHFYYEQEKRRNDRGGDSWDKEESRIRDQTRISLC